jgi:hypothetical protein
MTMACGNIRPVCLGTFCDIGVTALSNGKWSIISPICSLNSYRNRVMANFFGVGFKGGI